MENQQRIDVHSHFLPEQYLKALNESGVKDIEGFPIGTWSLVEHLKVMNQNEITKCLISISSPGLNFISGTAAQQLARSINETAADIKKAQPDRFGAFALLPLPDVDAAVQEIAYALDVLNLEGIGLYTNYGGVYLGDKTLDPVFDELNRRKATVFVHPTAPSVFESLSLGFPAPMIEYPFDSTRMVINLISSGTLERCPDIKIIVSHGGGTIPFLAPRIAGMMAGMKRSQNPREYNQKIMQLFGSLYFDLTAATHPGALYSISKLMPASHLLMGFDYPYMPPVSITGAVKDFYAFNHFTAEEHTAIEYGNILSMLK